MIEIRWKITDDLAQVSLEEYERDRSGYVDGWLEIAIGREKLGFYPDEDMRLGGTEGLETMAPCEGREYVEVRLIRRSSLVKEAAWPKEEKKWTAV